MSRPAPSRLLAYGCLALSMTLVGSYVGLSKILLATLPVFLLAWLRFGIGALAMVHWLRRPAVEAPMTTSTRWWIFVESLLGNFLFSILMLYGMRLTSALAAGVILAAIPAAVAVMSRLFLGERLSRPTQLGVLCAVTGIGLAALSSDQAQAASLLGNLLIFAAMLCESAYTVIGRHLSGHIGPRRISALINLWGLALMTPWGLAAAWHFDFQAVALDVWVLLVFYALAASVWTVWLWMTGMRTVPAAQGGVFTVFMPLSTALVGLIWLGESMEGKEAFSFVLALLGVLLATLPRPGKPQASDVEPAR